MATPTDDNEADGNLGKYIVRLIWRRYTSGFIPAVLKNSSILRIAPLLCPNIHEKGKGVLQKVKSIFFPVSHALNRGE